ncbi:response regulator [Aporhodopirellula aestuarii]|uniref:histidine kinase n=1 Tax=Aporhodopirellula aestuarii TaxID=2950107 RepID=A0ABT0TXQ7_9BACT|nr:response regulator [Aporhodopirellula aestuarii]MCM2369373.1 response regulator [Aporhodopirellula aestuarii]
MHRSVALQLALFTSLLLIVTGGLLSFVGYNVAQRMIRDQIHNRLKSLADDRRAMIQEYVDRQKERVALVASRTRLRTLIDDFLQGKVNQAEMRSDTQGILLDALASTKDFRVIAIVGTDGRVLTTTDTQHEHFDFSALPAFQHCLTHSTGLLSEPFIEDGRLLAHLSAPTTNRDGSLLGVLIVILDVEQLESILVNVARDEHFGTTSELLLGRRDKDQIHYLLPSRRQYKRTAEAMAVPGMVDAIEGKSGFGLVNYDNVPVLLRYEPVEFQPGYRSWGLVAKIDVAEAYTPLVQLRITLLALQAGLLGVGLLATFWLARRLTTPVLKLNEAAGALSTGDLSRRVDVKRSDELGQLADSFNRMAANLQELNSELERKVADRTQELKSAHDQAQLANRAKGDFLANMSHEIRTPLNAIIGLTEVVMRTDLDETQRDYLGTVVDSAESLLGIINDILDFSKIEAGKLHLEHVPFNLHDTVGDTLKSLAVRAQKTGIELVCFVDPEIPSVLLGDPTRLRQIITNLVANAIKFTHDGEVVVRVVADPIADLNDNEGTDHGRDSSVGPENDRRTMQRVLFSVRDTGIGIAPDKVERLFEAFEQGDASTARQFGGTGLGLSICMRLVKSMQGQIRVESTRGQGSTFSFTACFGVPESAPDKPRKLGLPLEQMRVLIVDDNETNRKILQEVTLAKRMRPVLADSAQAAIAVMQQAWDQNDPIRLVLSDVMMPGSDGFDLAQMIRRDARFDDVEIIFLTSAGHRGDLARCKNLRVAARLMKPVKQSELYEVMVRTLGIDFDSLEGRIQLVPESIPELRPLRILLAEDSVANQKVALAILNERGHTVVTAGNGRHAIELLDAQDFDVVLMDVQMPEMDGLQATAEIRRSEEGTGHHQQIIAMTAEAMMGDREKCLAAGMDDYVTKPVRKTELFAALQRVVEVAPRCVLPHDQQPQSTLVTASEKLSAANVPESTVSADQETQRVDWSWTLKQVNDNHEVLHEIVESYVEEIRDNLSELPQCIAAEQTVEVKRRAHMLAGAMRMFGADDQFRLARELESLAAGGVLTGAETLCSEVDDSIQLVLPELEGFLARGIIAAADAESRKETCDSDV